MVDHAPGRLVRRFRVVSGRGKTFTRSLTAAKFALAALLLVWVGMGLPWQDQLLWKSGGEEWILSGELEGAWRSEEVLFRLPEDTVFESAWPEEAGVQTRAGLPLELTRKAPDAEQGYDWRPSMPRVFREMKPGLLLQAFAFIILGTLVSIVRWWRLLGLAQCGCTLWNALRLSFLGVFFNLVIPGLTGGDVVKAVLVVREHPERRADALMSVVLDRLIGLWGLIILAGTVIWFAGEALAPLRIWLSGALALSCCGMAFILSGGLRRKFGLDRLIARLPGHRRIERLEQAAQIFSRRPFELILAVFFSFGSQLGLIAGVFTIGHAFGDALSFPDYIGVVSIANVLSSIPISPSGWGVGEAAYHSLFELAGSVGALGVAVSVTYRLCAAAMSLVGGVFLIAPGGKRMRAEVREIDADSAL